MKWMEDLMDEYPTNRSDRAIARLTRTFADKEQDVMEKAADLYMLAGNRFFPKVSDFVDYVKEAEGQVNNWGYYWGKQIRQAKEGEDYTAVDDAILEWELANGHMRPLAEIEREIKEAAQNLKQLTVDNGS